MESVVRIQVHFSADTLSCQTLSSIPVWRRTIYFFSVRNAHLQQWFRSCGFGFHTRKSFFISLVMGSQFRVRLFFVYVLPSFTFFFF